MSSAHSFAFKLATEPSEFEQIHRLNYRTFVEEIPQHRPEPGGRLVDKFHADNTYLICLRDPALVGMLAVRGRRPFSLDYKLPDLDARLPAGRRFCEVRLLAIEKEFRGARGGKVLSGLLALLWQHAKEHGYDAGVISGTTRQLKLYEHLGFVAFGPLVGEAGAQFQPMYVCMESFEAAAREFSRCVPASAPRAAAAASAQRSAPLSFLPGPVPSRCEVRRAFEQPPESHRTEGFRSAFRATQRLLCELAQARHVQVLMGSGTLANDVIAGQLALLPGSGVVLSNGEFGERLIDHARRFQLRFEAVRFPWGSALELDRLLAGGSAEPPAWLWCVHCETSTGVLNDLTTLKRACAARQVKLCLDCISSVGAVALDLEGVHLASGSSGKALRAYPGLSMVFHGEPPEPAPDRLPRYLDLGSYAREATPFSFSSNLLYGLQAALTGVDWPARFAGLVQLAEGLLPRLRAAGFDVVGSGARTSPAVITLALPPGSSSGSVGADLEEAGYLLSYNSRYLLERNWIQICLMGESSPASLASLVEALRRVCLR